MYNDKNSNNVARSYRSMHAASDLIYFQVGLKETDLSVGVDKESFNQSLVTICEQEIRMLRGSLESYISIHPEFQRSLVPLSLLPGAPSIAVTMSKAAWQAGVGPMAAVAGAFAETIGRKLKTMVKQIIVENGGDIYIDSSLPRLVSVFAGQSQFSHKIAIRIYPEESPLGICTSSGTVGPSLSFGKADAVVIKALNISLADAVATGAANRIQTKDDFMLAIEYVKKIPGVSGILTVKDDKLGAWGNIELVPVG